MPRAVAFNILEWAWARGTWKRLKSTICFFLLSVSTPPGGRTAATIPAFPLDIDSDSLPVSHATQECCSLKPATAFLVLQELLTPYLFWCATGGAILKFDREERSSSE